MSSAAPLPVSATTKRHRSLDRGHSKAKPGGPVSVWHAVEASLLRNRLKARWVETSECSGTTTTRCGGPSLRPKFRFSSSTCDQQRARREFFFPLPCTGRKVQIPHGLTASLRCWRSCQARFLRSSLARLRCCRLLRVLTETRPARERRRGTVQVNCAPDLFYHASKRHKSTANPEATYSVCMRMKLKVQEQHCRLHKRMKNS